MHHIQLEEGAKAHRDPQRKLNPNMREEVIKEVLKLLYLGIIYSIPDSEWMCIDYRKLNAATRKDHFPLSFIDQMLERLAEKPYFCFLDGYSGYFHIYVDPEDQSKITFTCPFETYAYRRMPFGLCNAPGTFQRCMMSIFSDLLEECIEIIMDDFTVYGDSFDACLHHLDIMLGRCRAKNLVLNYEKCHFMVTEGIVLGHIVSEKEENASHSVLVRKIPTVPTWVEEFDWEVKDKKGTENRVADHLSRITQGEEEDEIPDAFPEEHLYLTTMRPQLISWAYHAAQLDPAEASQEVMKRNREPWFTDLSKLSGHGRITSFPRSHSSPEDED
ncbi:hypothetical protein AAHA92_33196 [Salvia divinorum]|uniref:Reverse transcriptase domain-containing protein n=1 Tax=Salvia divinorum TaxID=28513 RepID=A0ABD1FN70_SALDI